MGHNRDGTKTGFIRIRGKTWDDPGRQRRKRQNVNYILIINPLTGRKWLEWENICFWKNSALLSDLCVKFLTAKCPKKTQRTHREKSIYN